MNKWSEKLGLRSNSFVIAFCASSIRLARLPGDGGEIVSQLLDMLFAWTRRLSQRTTLANRKIMSIRSKGVSTTGVMIGVVDEEDVPKELTIHYRDRKATDNGEKPAESAK